MRAGTCARGPRRVAGLAAALVLMSLGVAPALVLAEPWIAQREAAHCSRCHVNRAGGGKRTAFGNAWAATHLTVAAPGPTAEAPAAAGQSAETRRLVRRLLDPFLARDISIGGDLRVGHSTLFAEKVHNSVVNPDASIYLEVSPGGLFTVYTDLSLAEGSVEPREAMLIVGGPPGLHLRAGWLLPPFGLRFWDDDAFTRSETGFNFTTADLGVEVGWEIGSFASSLALTNGAGGLDNDNAKQLSGLLEYATGSLRLGLSASWNETERDRKAMGGVFAATSLGRVTLLGEVDVIETRYAKSTADIRSLAARVEADLLVHRGVNLQLVYGYHDPAFDVAENERLRLRAAVEVFPLPYISGRVVYDLRSSVPQDEVGNADGLLVELHGYF